MPRVVPLLLVVLTASAGCGGSDAPAPTDTGSDAPEAEAGDAITDSDSGGSFTLAAGGETSLRLSSDYVWDEPGRRGRRGRAEPASTTCRTRASPSGSCGASGPGAATISALGTPACAGEDGCPDEPLRFRVTITVSG